MKKCIKCGESKELEGFYSHPQMKDGRLNKCKECCKAAARKNREQRLDYYRTYDRARGARQTAAYRQEYRRRYPAKYRAQNAVSNAIRDGKLHREPCEKCGQERSHAHHDDYSRPLDVRWLCPPCHKLWHKENGAGANG